MRRQLPGLLVKRRRTLFRADHNESQGVEVAWLRALEDVTDERRRADQHGGAISGDFSNQAGRVGGIRVVDHTHAAQERHNHAGRDAEAVKRG